MWQTAIVHEGLNAFRMVRGSTKEEVETKARLQLAAWNERWKRRQVVEARRQKNLSLAEWHERQVDLDRRARAVALERTKEAERATEILNTLLQAALAKPPGFDWNRLSDLAPFAKPAPVLPELKTLPREPLMSDSDFQYTRALVRFSLIERLIPPLQHAKQAREQAAENVRKDAAVQLYAQAHNAWKEVHDEVEKYNTSAKLTYGVARAAWLKEKKAFEEEQLKRRPSGTNYARP